MDVRTKTGIQGLDKALQGGFPEGNIVLVSGGAGTGKSTLCLQFLVNGASLFGEKGLYVSTEQSARELAKHARGFGWDIEGLAARGQLKIIYFDITAGNDLLNEIDRVIREFKPKRVVIDSMTTLTDSLLVSGITEKEAFSMVQIAESVSPIPKTERIIAKAILYKLIAEIKKHGMTTILTSELYEEAKQLSADGISEFIADGVVVLHYLGIGQADFQTMQIRKMRYTAHDKRLISYEIQNKGITIVEGEL